MNAVGRIQKSPDYGKFLKRSIDFEFCTAAGVAKQEAAQHSQTSQPGAEMNG
jgi:hypothetical protein